MKKPQREESLRGLGKNTRMGGQNSSFELFCNGILPTGLALALPGLCSGRADKRL